MNGAALGTRRTFVVQIHADGTTTVENLRTRERVPVTAMSAIGDRIEAWLADAGAPPADRDREASEDERRSRLRGKRPPERGRLQ